MWHWAQQNYSTIQYNAQQEKKLIFFYCIHTMINGLNKFVYYFQRKNTNAIVKIPLIAQRSWVQPFLELSFSSTNKMDGKKFLK
jgi:hypothetical protein